MAPIIQIEHIRKVYRVGHEKVVALHDINLEIERGEFCCIVGASGSGKSTLLNQLAGLEKPTRGKIIIGGQNISDMSESELALFRQNNLGFVFQSYNLLPTMTAVENVALPLMFKGIPKAKREKIAAQQLAKMGLGKRIYHKPTEMSGGQQQRVGIARAFVAKPKVIFADEPTGNLDSHTTAKVMNAILTLARENNITFIMVTHERDLSGCADRIITLKDGHVIRNEKIENPNKIFEVQASPMDEDYEVGEQQREMPQLVKTPEVSSQACASQPTETHEDENQPVAELPLGEDTQPPLAADEYLP